MSEQCGCSEEFGPCEEHGSVLVVREGASVRTADELALCFIGDALVLGASLSAYGRDIYEQAGAALTEPCSWIEDPDLAQALHDLAWQVECSGEMPDDLMVVWDDGYVIYNVTGGPIESGATR